MTPPAHTTSRAPTPSRKDLATASQEARFRVDPEILRRRNARSRFGSVLRGLGVLALIGAAGAAALALATGITLYFLAADYERTASAADHARAEMYEAIESERSGIDNLIQAAPDPEGARHNFQLYRESTEPTKLQGAIAFLDLVGKERTTPTDGVTAEALDRKQRLQRLAEARGGYDEAQAAWLARTDGWIGRLLVFLRLARAPEPPGGEPTGA